MVCNDGWGQDEPSVVFLHAPLRERRRFCATLCVWKCSFLLPLFQELDGSANVAVLSPSKELPEEQMVQAGRKEVPTAIPRHLAPAFQ